MQKSSSSQLLAWHCPVSDHPTVLPLPCNSAVIFCCTRTISCIQIMGKSNQFAVLFEISFGIILDSIYFMEAEKYQVHVLIKLPSEFSFLSGSSLLRADFSINFFTVLFCTQQCEFQLQFYCPDSYYESHRQFLLMALVLTTLQNFISSSKFVI